MIAGLLFATRDALDRPDALAATLPLGGVTLIEFQARALLRAGATQLIVVVARMTPELLGAINRIGRGAMSVDVVRSAAEAAEKLHPLARVVMLADGLVTGDDVIRQAASGEGELLLTLDAAHAPAVFERLGNEAAWAGVARIDARRLGEAAQLPREWDLQSALLRVACAAGTTQRALPADAVADGHGIEHRAAAVAERGRAILAASVARQPTWFDRYLVGPIARRAVPALVDQAVPTIALAGGAGVLGVAGLAVLLLGYLTIGLALVTIATLALSMSTTLARLRDEGGWARGQGIAIAALAALAVLLLGHGADRQLLGVTATTLALGVVLAAALAERAALPAVRRRWWGSPPVYPLIALPLVAIGMPVIGLVVAGGYAVTSAAAAIEALRGHA